MPIPVTRSMVVLQPDQTRVLLRPFTPGGPERVAAIVSRVRSLSESQVTVTLATVHAEFSPRHRDLDRLLAERLAQVRPAIVSPDNLSPECLLLIGSYFLAEYSLESAALFNPSMVPHPDQSQLPAGSLRFVLSLRSTGEGHVSSIGFRTGTIDRKLRIKMDPPGRFLTEPRQIPNPGYEKPLFQRRLIELGLTAEFTTSVMSRMPNVFTLDELRAALDQCQDARASPAAAIIQEAENVIWRLACANHHVRFQPGQDFSERILFPATPSQRNGIEDSRFTHFRNEDGTSVYYATFTAYDGAAIAPEMLETPDFLFFQFLTLNGPAVRNKGMALFPRKIGGRYAMLSRQDNESIFLMFSHNVHFWNDYQPLLAPAFPWELIQIGNCGPPIETPAGWLVLSHGVGPMRTYCLGAFLLDLDDPSRVIGRLRQPLLEPNASERIGYVPNVVYSCGALVHQGQLILPYGIADHSAGFATVPLQPLLDAIRQDGV